MHQENKKGLPLYSQPLIPPEHLKVLLPPPGTLIHSIVDPANCNPSKQTLIMMMYIVQAKGLLHQFCPHNETLEIPQQPPVAYLTWQAGKEERDVTSRTKREDVEGPGHSAEDVI